MSDYQYIYNVNLLDDLHNYFPALLYDQERFQNTRDVLRYIREQTHNRFNLLNYGQSLYNDRGSVDSPPPPPRVVEPPITPPPQPPIRRAREEDIIHVNDSMSTTNLLLGLLGASMDTTPTLGSRLLNRVMLNPQAEIFTPRTFFTQNFLNPVVVRPTNEQIEANSEIVTDISGQCAICQDTIRGEDTCRRLVQCRHVYHRTCIDQWFQRSVQCPTCRHDIRDSPQARRQATEWGL